MTELILVIGLSTTSFSSDLFQAQLMGPFFRFHCSFDGGPPTKLEGLALFEEGLLRLLIRGFGCSDFLSSAGAFLINLSLQNSLKFSFKIIVDWMDHRG